MNYRDKYRDLMRSVVNEINVGGQQIDNENDDDDNDNFMDDSGNTNDNSSTPAPDDNAGDTTPPADDTNTTTDDVDDVGAGESDNFMDDGDGEGGDDTGTDDGSGDDTDDVGAGESDNFMDDDSNGGDDTGEEGSEETTDDTGNEEGSENGEEDYDLNKIEDELFSSLTPEQIAIKNHELKNQFIEVYSIIGSTLVRINDIPKSNDNINILKFVTEKLLELREMIDYNITVAYSTRTYIENNIIYQQCIATLNAIADIIDNIPNVNGGESNAEKEEENKEDEKGVPVEPDDTKQVQTLDVSDSSMSDYQEESANISSDYNDLF